MKRFYSVADVAARFEVTSQTVRNWILAGQLPSVQAIPGGRYRIDAQALVAFEQKGGLRPKEATMDREVNPPMNKVAASPPGGAIASELELVVRAIVKSVQPDGVILFGSRARGDFRADSDIDLAILAPDGVARRRVAMRAYESLGAVADRSVAVDIIVLTLSIISAERDLTGSVSRAVSREGVLLYGSPAAVA